MVILSGCARQGHAGITRNNCHIRILGFDCIVESGESIQTIRRLAIIQLVLIANSNIVDFPRIRVAKRSPESSIICTR